MCRRLFLERGPCDTQVKKSLKLPSLCPRPTQNSSFVSLDSRKMWGCRLGLLCTPCVLCRACLPTSSSFEKWSSVIACLLLNTMNPRQAIIYSNACRMDLAVAVSGQVHVLDDGQSDLVRIAGSKSSMIELLSCRWQHGWSVCVHHGREFGINE